MHLHPNLVWSSTFNKGNKDEAETKQTFLSAASVDHCQNQVQLFSRSQFFISLTCQNNVIISPARIIQQHKKGVAGDLHTTGRPRDSCGGAYKRFCKASSTAVQADSRSLHAKARIHICTLAAAYFGMKPFRVQIESVKQAKIGQEVFLSIDSSDSLQSERIATRLPELEVSCFDGRCPEMVQGHPASCVSFPHLMQTDDEEDLIL